MIGSTLSHYTILEKLGEGGMGVVYKARDTHLDRFVAIKVLPAARVADPERKRRFVQEAKAASALNHPNIITVHDIACENGVDFMVMEYLAGKPLDQAIPRRGMRVPEALSYAVQIADALACAHAAGIIHRDLKPGNVMTSEGGRVKLLDLGLAKLAEETADPDAGVTRSLWHDERPLTQIGTLLGTVAYMSPEQAEGRPLDGRSDIFAFGALLHEMVTGQRAFRGESIPSTLSAVLRDDPAAAGSLVEGLPRELERIISRCLRKDPNRRFQGMADLKVALEELKQESESGLLAVPEAAKRVRRRPMLWGLAAAMLLAAAGAGVWLGRGRVETPDAWLTSVPLTSYAGTQRTPSFSPDGSQVVFTWTGEKQENFDLYIKLVGPGTPLRLTRDPANDVSPAWSPDGRWIAFVRGAAGESSILLIPALGGPERKLADVRIQTGPPKALAWFPDGTALLVSSQEGPNFHSKLFLVTVATGEKRPLTSPPPLLSGDFTPAVSPDGRTIAFCRAPNANRGEIYTQALNQDRTPAGEPRQITFEGRMSLSPAWTGDGREIVFASGATGATLSLWRVAASGSVKPRPLLLLPGGNGMLPAISAQGNRLAYARDSSHENIWQVTVEGGKPGAPARFIPSSRRDFEPRFSPDGTKIAFSSDRSGSTQVWIANADGSGPVQLTSLGGSLTSGPHWSPDGRLLAFLSNAEGQNELYLMRADGGAPQRLTISPAHDTAPSWSRDGKWIYFGSNRGGLFQVWKMQPDPKSSPVQVTRSGGYAALESPDGKTLYFTKRNEPGVWKVPVEGGEESRVIPSLDDWGNFDLNGRGIYFIPNRSVNAPIQFYNFADGGIKTLAQTVGTPGFGLTVSPDRRTVLYSQVDQQTSELALVNFR
ncbi:MAG: serine/threonine-protein kinase [Acidobacteria bacterium]|nr:serine/threonine-protein kinase [Acidobacteriota bacterium]